MNRIDDILSKMTIKEKIKLLGGHGYWETYSMPKYDLTSVVVSDGPHGLRKEDPEQKKLGFNKGFASTCFPTASAMGCSFDKDLMYQIGATLATECKEQNVDVILGPGISMKRSPLCGRNFEYISEDPYLSGKLAAAYIQGIQAEGVGTSLKHFAVNNQEMKRLISNSCVDERTLHEIYFKGFEIAVKEGKPWTIMASYNRINGVYSCENEYLLKKVLRESWGYKGLVVSDWGALNNPVKSYKNGLNLEMPGLDHSRVKYLYKAFKKGKISQEEIDIAVRPVLELEAKVVAGRQNKLDCDYHKNALFAQTVAENCAVLLKNEKDFLPLSEKDKILVVGDFAKKARYQGIGSSNIVPKELDCFIDALDEEKIEYEYAEGFNLDNDDENEKEIAKVLELAKKLSKVVVIMGLPDSYEAEGYDRKKMNLPPNQVSLLNKLLEVNKNVVVVLQAGSPVEMPFVDNVPSILMQYLSGCRSGHALLNLLFGKVNPSGKLAETFPIEMKDNPIEVYPDAAYNVEYKEGEYVGYRYYDHYNKNVLFPFGYGLSYSKFVYEDFFISKDKKVISFNVKNIGKYEGKESVQLYVEYGKGKSFKSLKDFAKVSLKPGESKKVEIAIEDEYFTFYDVKEHRFVEGKGNFIVEIGSSSREIKFSETITRSSGTEIVVPGEKISFEQLPVRTNNKKKHYDMNSTTEDLKSCHLGRQLNKIIIKVAHKIAKDDPTLAPMIDSMLTETPLRYINLASEGKFTYHKIEGLIDVLNGHFFRGLGKMMS